MLQGCVGGYLGYQRYLNTLPEIVETEIQNRKEREKIVIPTAPTSTELAVCSSPSSIERGVRNGSESDARPQYVSQVLISPH